MTKSLAETILGPIYIGTILNVALYGIIITQVYLYFSNYNDRLWIKIFVGLLFFADTLNSVLDVVYIYDAMIIHFADDTDLNTINWIMINAALTGIIAGNVQLFFAWRVKTISGNKWMTAFIVICAVVDMLAGIGTSISLSIYDEFSELRKSTVFVVIWLGSAILADIAISSCLVWNLARRKTGFAATDDIVDKIIRMTVQTGLLTSAFAAANMIACLVDPTSINPIFNMPLSKLYTNSLMSSLNARTGTKFTMGHPMTLGNAQPAEITFRNRAEVYLHVELHQLANKPVPKPETNFNDSDEHDLHRKYPAGDSQV